MDFDFDHEWLHTNLFSCKFLQDMYHYLVVIIAGAKYEKGNEFSRFSMKEIEVFFKV